MIDDEQMETDPELENYITQIKSSISKDDISWLRRGMKHLKQIKPSTALKQLARLGVMKLDSDKEMVEFLADNSRLNEKNGVYDISRDVENALRKVPKI